MKNSENKTSSGLINKSASEIIRLVDGTLMKQDIIDVLSRKYKKTSRQKIEENFENLIYTLSTKYNICIKTSDKPLSRKVEYISNNIIPGAASLEITDKCNLRCRHCYGNFGPDKKNCSMDLENIKKILFDLFESGVKLLELTGGDISTHPHLKDILVYALSLNFVNISLLTNGILLNEDTLDIIIKHKNRFIVQIDVHSFNDDYLKWFTGKSGYLDKIKNTVCKLAKNGVIVRVAMIVTPKNLDEIIPIAEWAHSNQVRLFGASPVINLGRACINNDLLLSDDKEMPRYIEIMENLKKCYGDNFIFESPDNVRVNNNNCGCVTSHIVINSKGTIKLCTMDDISYCNTNFGNLLKKDLKKFYQENCEFMNKFSNWKSPRHNSDECKNCEFKFFCDSCILRGLTKASILKNKCKWYNNIDATIKNQLGI